MKRNFYKLVFGSLIALASLMTIPLKAAEKSEAKQPIVLIMLGKPGGGKGTQAKLLNETLQLPHISTGDLLRDNIKQATPLGKQAKSYMDQGSLVPDSLILDMLFDRVGKKDSQNGYILDGFPRTLGQAEAYHRRLKDQANVVSINLDLSDHIIVQRLSQRIVCKGCGAPYHLKYCPPKKDKQCDQCLDELIQRADDTEAVVRKRLHVYQEQTAPLIAFYQKNRNYKIISCDQLSKGEVFQEISAHLANAK